MLKNMLFTDSGVGGSTGSWLATLGGDNTSLNISSMAISSDGYIYILGTCRISSVSSCLLAKYDSYGVLQWCIKFTNNDLVLGYDVEVGEDGYVYVCGEFYATSHRVNSRLFLAKYSSSGTLQWQRQLYLNGGLDDANISLSHDNSIYITGDIYNASTKANDVFLAKYNSSGDIQWQRVFGGSREDYDSVIAVSPDDNYVYINTAPNNTTTYHRHPALVKYNSSGDIKWQKEIHASNDTERISDSSATCLVISPNGYNIYTCGSTDGMYAGYTIICKYSSSGSLNWIRRISLSDFYLESLNSIALDRDGSIYVLGSGRTQSYHGILLAKLSSYGDLLWLRTITTSNHVYSVGMTVVDDGTIYICGLYMNKGILAKITDKLILKSKRTTVEFGPFTLQNVAGTVTTPALKAITSSYSSNGSSITSNASSLQSVTVSLESTLYMG